MVSNAAPQLLAASKCLPGRSLPVLGGNPLHFLTGNPILPPYPSGFEIATFGMGCFWCSEGHFARLPGIYVTLVGYSQGVTKNPTYEEVCSGRTNHAEVVRIVFDPARIGYISLLKDFWELHDPSTHMKQGNDVGTQYRSGIYFSSPEHETIARITKQTYEKALDRTIFTEIEPVTNFYPAEECHQQYDMKPGSRQYCGLRPTGVALDV